MDEQAAMPRKLIDGLFTLGVMGIETPEELGGSGASFFHAVLAVEALSRVAPAVAVLVDVQNTLVVNALLRWGTEDLRRRYLPRLSADTVGAYALSVSGPGSDAVVLAARRPAPAGR
jgi:alkylation response protein AidB-like acyl-CoA dehydrogenase